MKSLLQTDFTKNYTFLFIFTSNLMNYIIISIIIVALVIGYLIWQYKRIKNLPVGSDSPYVVTLTDANVKQHITKGVVLIDFWAAWCMPCKMIGPVINELAEEMKDQAVICKLNIDEHQKTAQMFGVRSIPTLVILKNGKEVERIVGVKSKNIIKKQLEKHLQ
jgi:thioredoxin 1